MIRYCLKCGKQLSNRNKKDYCKPCCPPSRCQCGQKKDYRARQCRSCGSRTMAKKQWKNSTIRIKMMTALKKSGMNRRARFEDIKWDANWRIKTDGRYFIRYWDDNLKKFCWIYRYQWVWICAHGPIPMGHQIHHKNLNSADDCLENLELMERHKHARLHSEQKSQIQRATWKSLCPNCGKYFPETFREGRKQIHCSLKCRHENNLKKILRICQNCGIEFYRKGKLKFCSRKCWKEHFSMIS